MRLSRIFTQQALKTGRDVDLAADKAHYIGHVLRLKPGQLVALFNGHEAADYEARIDSLGKASARLHILQRHEKSCDPDIRISLIQAIGKFDTLDLIVQKATEIGVHKLIFFNAERTQFPLKDHKTEKKLAHWRGIIESACEQCGRNSLPSLTFYSSLEKCLADLPPANRLLLDFGSKTLSEFTPKQGPSDFQLLIGPEGGLNEREVQSCKQQDFSGCTLGPRVLRMETAAISILGLIQHLHGDM
jgi:16S rRNA (uracil1498-N3)-methyltransferase